MAKKKRRGTAPPGVDPNELRRQKLEARREQKAAALREAEKRETRERLVRRVALFALAAVAIWFVFLRGGTPDVIAGHAIENFSTAGSGDHTASNEVTVDYPMSPPVSGQHAPNPAPCGVQDTQIQNELMVHTLEHGAIGLLYKPDLEIDSIRSLENIVSGYDDHVFSAPYADMSTPIAIVAWAHTMRLDSVDEAAIQEFIDTFKTSGDAPEPEQVCDNTQNSPFQAAESDPSNVTVPDTPLPDATATDGG
ncbi:MAG: hypothetical protein QOG54_1261 [Actinomycetota bacterium]|jgi:hypothetical protein|nr:hypothetical protein [Actinomycetota bacterium]